MFDSDIYSKHAAAYDNLVMVAVIIVSLLAEMESIDALVIHVL